MHNLNRRRLLASALVFAGGTALAQQPGAGSGPSGPGAGPGPGPGMGRGAGMGMLGGGGPGGGMMGGMADPAGYLASLKVQLGITEAQTAAWTAYADTVTGTAGQMQGMHQTMWDSMQTANWQERRNMMNTMFEARQQAFATVHDAATKLLTDLTPAQREQAVTMLPGLAARGGRGRGMGRGMGPGMMGPGMGPNQMGGRPAPG